MAKTLYFANDTSAYHGGSWAVCQVLLGKATRAGWQVAMEGGKTVVDHEAIAACDAVLVNGEGTMHSGQARARHLLAVLDAAQAMGKRTVLCNSTWFRMGSGHADTIRKLDHVSVRDPASAREMLADTGRLPEVALDLSFWQPATPAPERLAGVLATDFYSREFGCFVDPKGGPLAALARLDMRASSWEQSVDRISSCRFFMTGRFHGMMIALKTRTPFVAFPGNTPKIEATLEWLGAESLLVPRFADLRKHARGQLAPAGLYAELFDQVHAMPEWRFPL